MPGEYFCINNEQQHDERPVGWTINMSMLNDDEDCVVLECKRCGYRRYVRLFPMDLAYGGQYYGLPFISR